MADDKPSVLTPAHVNVGIAIDLAKPDGTRQLLVPSIKKCETLDFAGFWSAYEDVVRRARGNKLTVDDFAGTTISLTNPGTIGTVHSVPRLMQGQGTIVGVGAMDYPAEFAGTSEDALNKMGVSKVLTLTSTYDHRIIQGAQSGDFLRIIGRKLLGEDGFYDRVFAALRVPYEPVRWVRESADADAEAIKPARIAELIHSYRSRGHLMADTDPLAYRQRKHPDLDVQTHGLTLWDLDRTFPTGGFGGKPRAKLREVLGLLRDSYCRTVGSEYMHLQDPRQRTLAPGAPRVRVRPHAARGPAAHPAPPQRGRGVRDVPADQVRRPEAVLARGRRVGHRRCSTRSCPRRPNSGLDEVGIGMAHRGRLNVLANIAGKSYAQIFSEFEGNQDPKSVQGSGDVKYHLGTEGTFTAESGATTAVYLAANPSHLEAVDPVLEGIVRAKQDRIDLGGDGFSVLPILIHGDAAFAGQGVVFETLNLAQLRGYRTGGTIHVIINNQVGFTTGPSSSRSSQYATDVAKGLQVPIFHVNGDDPEACVRVAELAFEYREQFDRDVIIDMVCYRRRGHNEGDDPSMTQPLMYNLIEAKRSVRKLYTETLVARGDLTIADAEQALQDYQSAARAGVHRDARGRLHAGPAGGRGRQGPGAPRVAARGRGRHGRLEDRRRRRARLERIGRAHVRPPEGFTVHPKLAQLLAKREAMTREGGIDWGYGELLAFGSLLVEGTPGPARRAGLAPRHVRAAARGHARPRHRRRVDARCCTCRPTRRSSGSTTRRCRSTRPSGSSTATRSSARTPWCSGRRSSATSSTAPRRSSTSSSRRPSRSGRSARRSCSCSRTGTRARGRTTRRRASSGSCSSRAEDNMTIAQPSTPASHFHLLRRQAYDRPRRPLVVFTPKSMLRLKSASSDVEDFTSGTFRTVIGDDLAAAKAGQVTRVLLCSGKVYWDLLAHRVKTRRRAHGDRPARAALPARRRGGPRRGRAVRRRRAGVGAGRAAQPGPVDVPVHAPAAAARTARSGWSPARSRRRRPPGPPRSTRPSRRTSSRPRSRADDTLDREPHPARGCGSRRVRRPGAGANVRR